MAITSTLEIAKGVVQENLSVLHPFTNFIRETALLPIASLLKMDLMIMVLILSILTGFILTRMEMVTMIGKIKFTVISVSLFILLFVV